MKSEQTQNKEICLINHEGLEPNTGMVLIAAAVRKVEGEEKQQLLVRVPTAYALVIPAGVQIKIDEQQPIQLQYTICFPTSCQVQIELTKELFDSMRKGKQMVVAAMNIQQKTMGFPVPLTGFAKAYDGAPVDSVKYEESRRQLMEVFRKRQAELAAKAAKASSRTRRQRPRSGRSTSGPERHDGAAEEAGSRDAVSAAHSSSGIKRAASVSGAAFRLPLELAVVSALAGSGSGRCRPSDPRTARPPADGAAARPMRRARGSAPTHRRYIRCRRSRRAGGRTAGPCWAGLPCGMERYHSSVLEKVGSTSKITPRNG